MINWKVRIRNKQFWVSAIPALALVVQAISAVFGWTLDFTSLTGRLIAVVDAVFALLVILGMVIYSFRVVVAVRITNSKKEHALVFLYKAKLLVESVSYLILAAFNLRFVIY